MPIVRSFQIVLTTLLCAACAKQAESPAPASTTAAASPASDTAFEFRIGELAAFALRDGGLKLPNDNKVFGVGRTPEEVATVLSGAGVPATELSLSVQPLLVRAGDKVLLFDTGAGSNMGAGAGQLPSSLQQAGIEPAGVTDIFISHVHGDHIGGLLDASGALAFANATVHMSAPEWSALQAAEANAALVAALTPKIDAFAPGSEVVPGVVTAVEIKGHTAGHSGYRIGAGAESLLYIGDTAHHYVVSVQQPEWTVAFDGDAPAAQSSRKELIAQSAAANQRIYAVHFPYPGLGKFTQQGDHYAWTPEQ